MFQTFNDMIQFNYDLMQENKVLIVNDPNGFLVEPISLNNIEDPDTLKVLSKIIPANQFIISFDSQEAIIYPPRVAHYGVLQLRKQYVTALASMDFVIQLRNKVEKINEFFNTPILYLTGIPLFNSYSQVYPIKEPNNFLQGSDLNLTFLIDDLSNSFDVSANVGEFIAPGEKAIIQDLESKFSTIGLSDEPIVMFSVHNIHIVPQIDLWDLIICVGSILNAPVYRESEIWKNYFSTLPVAQMIVYLSEFI